MGRSKTSHRRFIIPAVGTPALSHGAVLDSFGVFPRIERTQEHHALETYPVYVLDWPRPLRPSIGVAYPHRIPMPHDSPHIRKVSSYCPRSPGPESIESSPPYCNEEFTIFRRACRVSMLYVPEVAKVTLKGNNKMVPVSAFLVEPFVLLAL